MAGGDVVAHQWIRLDTNLPTHDKIMRLTSSGNYRAAFAYVCALAWSGGNGTHGRIPTYVLALLHARKTDADALVEVGLFDPTNDGWEIHNWRERQTPHSGKKGACKRWHDANCECWRDSDE